MVLQHLEVQSRILKYYLEGTEDPVRVAQSELKDKFPEIFQEIQEVADAVNAKSSLGWKILLKGTVVVNSRDPLFKEGHAQFTISWKP